MILATQDLNLLAELEKQVPEFETPYSLERLQARLEGRKSLILLAYDGETPIGYKVGYQDTPRRFYSWIGGIVPGYRRQGWARKLLLHQEEWCREQAYQEITVWTANQYRGMLVFLLLQGYDINALSAEGKIQLRKRL